MLKIEGLGPGYCTWANAVVQGWELLEDIIFVFEDEKYKSRLTTYFGLTFSQDMALQQEGRRSLASNGPIGTITHVRSSQYPDEAQHIKISFLPVVTPAGLGPTAAAPS